ncbi:MAG: nucleic acid/nucleotide deaminase domain-containing protein, partial [Cyclobacteriaceae bacterium]
QNIQHINRDIATVLQDLSPEALAKGEHPGKAVVIEDKNGEQYVVQKDKDTGQTTVTKVAGGGLNPGSNTTAQADPIKDRIIVLILEQFEEEIAAWLRINGKGGEDDPDVYLAAELPMSFPKHAAFLTHLKTEVIPYFKEHPEKLRNEVERSNKAVLDKSEKLFKTKDDVEWTKVEVSDQELLRDATGTSLMNLAGGEINTSEIIDLIPDCGRKHVGKDKPFGSLFLISYPEDCSYMREGIVNYYITKGYGKYLCAQERFDLIKCLATGIVSGGEEQSIITLINETPKAHASALLSLLNADNSGLLRNIDDGFQFGNYVTVFKAIQQLYLSGTTQAVINAEVEKINSTFLSDKTREEKAQQNYFTWFEGGILKAMFADNFVFGRFDDVSISNNGTVSFNYATDPRQTGETTTPINIKPFALVGIRVRGNTNDVLEAGNGSMVYVPGIMLPLLISKKETAEFFDALNATAVVTGVGAIVTGATRFAIVTGGIDILLGGSALVVDSYKDDILKMQNGEAFLDAYVLVNKAFLIYFGSRTILQLTQALPKLSSAFTTFKNSDDFAKLKTTNPSKASQIEKEIDDLIKESDEVLVSARASTLLQKIQYGSEELSKMVQNFRKTTGKKTGNVAVIEYVDNSGIPKYQIGESTGIYNPHAEKAAWLKLESLGVKPEQITRIYTELEPCASRGRYCKNFITRTFPNAKTSYSFDYLNGTTESCKASVKTLGEQVNLLFE